MSLPAPPPWREEPVAKHHDRAGFDCGEPALNEFLAKHARANHERGASKTFVAVSQSGSKEVLGYYTLSPAAVHYAQTPDILRKGLGRYDVPAFRLGRLAVGRPWQGCGLGGQLLLAAGRRCLRVAAEVGGVLLLIDAKNEHAAAWYARYGAMGLLDRPLSLVFALATFAAVPEA